MATVEDMPGISEEEPSAEPSSKGEMRPEEMFPEELGAGRRKPAALGPRDDDSQSVQSPTQALFLQGSPTSEYRRANRQKALEMDETLDLTTQMKSQVEQLKQKQLEMAERMKNRRTNIENEHKSTLASLDTAMAAQEEYRKGYNSVRKAYMKAKQDLEETTQAFKNVTRKQREKSKQVLERMVRGTETTMALWALQEWEKMTKENQVARQNERLARETQEEVNGIQEQLAAFKSKKRDEAMKVMDRLNAASESGLVSMMFKSWQRSWEEAQEQRAEAQRVRDSLSDQKASARRTLEKSLGSALGAAIQAAFNDWRACYLEAKQVAELQSRADAAMKRYQAKKKDESSVVIDRMSKEKTSEFLSLCLLIWYLVKMIEQSDTSANAERELLKGFMERQKAKSKQVVDRMIRGNVTGMATLCIKNWIKIMEENRVARENEAARKETEEEMLALQEQMQQFTQQKKGEAMKIMDRMSAASDTGLMATNFQSWARDLEEVREQKAEAQRMQELMKGQKESARRTLEKSLGSALGALAASAFNDWVNYWEEQRNIQDLKNEAERSLRKYKATKKDQSIVVVDKMCKEQSVGLLQQVFLVWMLGQEFDKLMSNYLDEKEVLQSFINRQKEKSKSVLDRLTRGQDSSLATIVFQAWQKETIDNAQARINEKARQEDFEEVQRVQAKMLQNYKDEKRAQAKAVMERLTAASEQGLVSLMFSNWLRDFQEIQEAKAEAKKMRERLKMQKDDARRVLEKSLGSAMDQIVASAFNDWVSTYTEEKSVRELKAQADKKMKSYKSQKHDQSMKVVERMSGSKDKNLMFQCVIVWRMLQELNVMHNYIERQRKKARTVVDSMVKSHDSTKIIIAWQSWDKVTKENRTARENEKAQRESEEEMLALRAQMGPMLDKKKDEVMSIMDRMASAQDTGLVSVMFNAWRKDWEDIQEERAEAKAVKERLQTQKCEARRILEKNLGTALVGILGSTMSDWINYYLEEKNIRELKKQAESKMKSYRETKRGQSMVVVDRMSAQKDQNLKQQAILVWHLSQEIDKLMADYNEDKKVLEGFLKRQKEKSKGVIDRFTKENDSSRILISWQSWVKVTEENRIARENERALKETEEEMNGIRAKMGQMKSLQGKKTNDTRSVLQRMATAQNAGLIMEMFRVWQHEWDEVRKQKAAAAAMQSKLVKQKAEARRVLEKNLGEGLVGLLGSCFKDWQSIYYEEVKVRGIMAEADKKMKDYKSQKRSESMVVVDQMCGYKQKARMQQVIMVWYISISEMIRTNALQAELHNIMDLQRAMEQKMMEVV